MTDTTQERRHHPPVRYGAAPEVKQKHRAMWALGDYAAVASDIVAPLGHVLVEACHVAPGDRLLDVAAGSGTAAVPAARAGARVTASDLTPELLAVGERLTAAEGLDVTWEEGDAEALPHPDGTFDVTTSCVGVMFAPFHRAAADELVRVTRSDGRIGLVSWTPEGFIGEMFSIMKPYAPPPPPGAQPPPLWGDESHVRDLLGDRVDELETVRDHLVVDRFATVPSSATTSRRATARRSRSTARSPTTRCGPPRSMPSSPPSATGTSAGDVMRWEYLLLTARRR